MPTLKQLTCCIEWANSSIPFKEYGITYGDGSVDCFIPIQPASTPFSVRLTSKGYIAPGLAMFVYMDGVYQCNRNRIDLIANTKPVKGKKKAKNVNFCVRQKEERLTDGTWIGRPWRFEPLQIVQLMPGMPEINKSHFDNLGEITVVVLRCESQYDHYPLEGSLSPESAMAFGPDLDDDLRSISSDECILGPRDTTAGDNSGFGLIGGLFDGTDDRRAHNRGRVRCDTCTPQGRQGCDRCHERSPRPGCTDACCRPRNKGQDRHETPRRARWKDNTPRAETLNHSHNCDTYDDDDSSVDSDRIRRGYRHYRSKKPTHLVPEEAFNKHNTPHCYRNHFHNKHRGSSPERSEQRQCVEPRSKKVIDDPSPNETKRAHTVTKEEGHNGDRGCGPSIVLNVNSTQPAPTISQETRKPCPRHRTVRRYSTHDTTDDDCYVMSNDERIKGRCHHHRRSHSCCKHKKSNSEARNNPTDKPAAANNDGNQNTNNGWGTSPNNQGNNNDWMHSNNAQVDQNCNGNQANNSSGWQDQQDNQNANPTNGDWDQNQGDQGWDQAPNDSRNNNNDHAQKASSSRSQGGHKTNGWDNGDGQSGQDSKNRGLSNGDGPAAGWGNDASNGNDTWQNNDNNNAQNNDWQDNNNNSPQNDDWKDNNNNAPSNGWDNNYNQNGPATSPNNGYNNTQPFHTSPPPQDVQIQPQGTGLSPTLPVQSVHTLITPFRQGNEASEPPLYTVPYQVAQERSLSHQVQVGRSSVYSHRIHVPHYLDSMEEPYAKFVFKYRVKDVIASETGKPVERDFEAERKVLESLPREEILNQLLHAQGLLAAQSLDPSQIISFQGQQQPLPFLQHTPAQQPNQAGSNTRNSPNIQNSQPSPVDWNNAPAQDEPMVVPSKLTGYRKQTNKRNNNDPNSSNPHSSHSKNSPSQDEPIVVPSKFAGYNNGMANGSQKNAKHDDWASQQQQNNSNTNGNANHQSWNDQSGQDGGTQW